MSPARPTNRDLILQREAEAVAAAESLLLRLEAAGEQVKDAEALYLRATEIRDRAIYEACKAKVPQVLIGAMAGLAQPNVVRARNRHRARLRKKARERAEVKKIKKERAGKGAEP